MECRASSVVAAKDLSQEEYLDTSKRMNMGKTTTNNNLQAYRHHWQNFCLTNKLGEAVLKNFLYWHQPVATKLVGLIDTKNYEAEGNLKSERQLSSIDIVRALFWKLGWESGRDEGAIKKEEIKRIFVHSVVDDPPFK